MKDYDLIIATIYQDLIKDVSADETFLYESNNKLIVWVVSLSVAAVGLIIGYSDKVASLGINEIESRFIIICLVISIAFAFLTRLFHLKLIRKSRYNATIFRVALQPHIVRSKPRELKGDEDALIIYEALKEDFDLDDPDLLQLVPLGVVNDNEAADEFCRKRYEEIVALDERNYNSAINTLNGVMNESLEIKPGTGDPRTLFRINRTVLSWLIDGFYAITFIAFLIALMLFILFSLFQNWFAL